MRDSSSTQIRVIDPSELDDRIVLRWHELRASSMDFGSPFFTPEFTRVMARCRGDVKIGLIENDRAIVAILPFHHKKSGVAVPVGGHLNDYQAIIGELPAGLSPADLLEGLQVSAFEFNHALLNQPFFQDNAIVTSRSPRVDLREGHEAWLSNAKRRTSAIKKTQRQVRRIPREIGELEFRFEDDSIDAWNQLWAWKAGSLNVDVETFFSPEWVYRVFHELKETQDDQLSGMLSTLYAGDKLIAAHFGLRSNAVLHWWFPSYDPALAKYSPGLVHLLKAIETAGEQGLQEIDFGRGDSLYKNQFSNAARSLCEGSLERIGTSAGVARRFRKLSQRAIDKTLPDKVGNFTMRLGNRWLMAGRLD